MSLARTATKEATTRRSIIVNGMRQPPVEYLTGFACTPPTMAGESSINEVRLHTELRAPYVLRETIVPGTPDIVTGDIVVIDNVAHTVHAVTQWERRSGDFLRVLMEVVE